MRNVAGYSTIDEYILAYPAEVQQLLQVIRATIQKAAPNAAEKISYGIPTFTLKSKNLVHFAAYQNHIGFYPGAAPIVEFKEDLKPYETSKGTVRFPLDKPIPYELITKLTLYRIGQINNDN